MSVTEEREQKRERQWEHGPGPPAKQASLSRAAEAPRCAGGEGRSHKTAGKGNSRCQSPGEDGTARQTHGSLRDPPARRPQEGHRMPMWEVRKAERGKQAKEKPKATTRRQR